MVKKTGKKGRHVTTWNVELARREKIGQNNKHHGMHGTKIYYVWQAMKFRCSNPNSKAYKNYGGRGIKVCDEWQSFENFYSDMKGKYKEGLLLERIDNNGNYEPNNCTWVTRYVQNHNKRQCRYITYKGKTQTMDEWAKELNIQYGTLNTRLTKRHWGIEKAFNEPVLIYNRTDGNYGKGFISKSKYEKHL